MSKFGENNDRRCWTPGEATSKIREKANEKNLDLYLTLHAKERMAERGIIMGDILSVLKNGFVFKNPENATRDDHYKYLMEGATPNSNSRVLSVLVIPGERNCLKIVTVMWRDGQ